MHLSHFAHLVLDWNPILKPEVPSQRGRRFPLPERFNDIAGEAIDWTGRRRQFDTSSASLEDTSRHENFILKTPRPDITMGLCHSVLIESLVVAGVDVMAADDFLKSLQDQQELCSDPSREALNIRFPVLVVEGKSYSAGKFVFEAQNQAAVSGSCMMKMQHQLADLSDLFAPRSHDKKEPLAFSICTQGPYMELWAHYTTSVSGLRKYNMNLVQVCNALILDGVLDFLVIVDRVLAWACSDFVDNVAKQLALVENAT